MESLHDFLKCCLVVGILVFGAIVPFSLGVAFALEMSLPASVIVLTVFVVFICYLFACFLSALVIIWLEGGCPS